MSPSLPILDPVAVAGVCMAVSKGTPYGNRARTADESSGVRVAHFAVLEGRSAIRALAPCGGGLAGTEPVRSLPPVDLARSGAHEAKHEEAEW